MTTKRKEELARKATLKIFSIILEEQNGYTKEDIKERKLDEDCEGSEIWDGIYKTVFNLCGKI